MSWAEKALIVILASMVGVIYFLSDSINSKNERIKQLNNDLLMQVAITADYEKRINSLHELDTKHTTELTNAKAEIDKLRDDVRSGRKRVYINADCPSSENGSTSSVDVSRPTPVARDTEENILNLEEQLETLEKQYLGLRDWYFAECKH
ncbi:lysis protein [Providencia rettgeri]|uniref:Bacteriophage lysis protein n=1 Tax=Providencia rettgeri TaxID=587 RepID=A0A379FTF8_PRORE|nr:lysis protein [Providencia rettgeri]SUC31971.1 Bacteriophage lysis protein [Providencia rettgeri]